MLEKKKEKNLIFGILKLKMEYAIIVSKIRRKIHSEQQTKTPERQLWGFLFRFRRGGLSHRLCYRLFVAIQPFANEMTNYTCHNGDKK